MEIYRGTRLSIEKREITLPDGKVVDRVVVHPGDAVAILPVRGDSSCYLIRQYRFAVGDFIYEAPAGTLDPGESPLDTAHRELIEETGFQAETLIPRGFIYTTPGFTDERIYLFEAHNLTPSCEFEQDEDEVIEVVKVTFAEIAAMITDGRISDAKTICLVYRCLGERR
ncbi:ADP-ribose pyrophosphatase [Methanolinea mesophila]|uniref:NUDIX hydrolase n=1 Tax=Methanolinea mesophila TaxID=547055 RepID=UPI001AE85496|nr:NUDIX hydrolase [Methanolinea mesophila]MBP1928601.1 ADP-ribose pyrophosphatase [Methanolinea mesophila]